MNLVMQAKRSPFKTLMLAAVGGLGAYGLWRWFKPGVASASPSMPGTYVPVGPGVSPAPSAQSAMVTGSGVALRSEPATRGGEATVLARPPQGAQLSVLNWNGAGPDAAAPMGWAQVRYGAVAGFMSKQYLSLGGGTAPAYVPPTPSPSVPVEPRERPVYTY